MKEKLLLAAVAESYSEMPESCTEVLISENAALRQLGFYSLEFTDPESPSSLIYLC